MAIFYSVLTLNQQFTANKFLPSSRTYYNRASRGNDLPHDKRKEISLPHIQLQQIASSDSQEAEENSNQEIIKIASVPLGHYKEDEISLEVDSEKVALHGLHLFEREKGFIASEFKRFFKLPEGVDPATVTSRSTKHGDVLIIEGMKYSERRAEDNKIDFRDFKAEEIKIQFEKDKLNVTGKSLSKDHPSTSRRILLPVDADLGSVTSHLSKESLLPIEASSTKRETVKVTMKTSQPCDERSTVELFALVV